MVDSHQRNASDPKAETQMQALSCSMDRAQPMPAQVQPTKRARLSEHRAERKRMGIKTAPGYASPIANRVRSPPGRSNSAVHRGVLRFIQRHQASKEQAAQQRVPTVDMENRPQPAAGAGGSFAAIGPVKGILQRDELDLDEAEARAGRPKKRVCFTLPLASSEEEEEP